MPLGLITGGLALGCALLGNRSSNRAADAAAGSAQSQEALTREAMAQEIEQRNIAQQFLAPFGSSETRRTQLQAELDSLLNPATTSAQATASGDVRGLFGRVLNQVQAQQPAAGGGAIDPASQQRISAIRAEMEGLQPTVTDLGLQQASFLTDPQQQFAFLQNNPLFDAALQNANQVLGGVFGWKPGRDVEVVLLRDGEEVIIKTTLTQAYKSAKILKEKENATDAQKALREAWLRG